MKLDTRPAITHSAQVSNDEYHALECLNASGIRLFLENRIKFYKEYILLEPRKEEKTHSTLIGNMVHADMAENGEYEDTYVLSSVVTPSGQMLDLCDTLYDIAKMSMVEENGKWVQQRQFSDLMDDAIQRVKYDYSGAEVAFKGKDKAKIVELFTTPDKKTGACGELYYQELLKNTGKVVVSVPEMQKAEEICKKLRTHPYTCDIVNRKTEEGVREILTEYIIQFTIGDIKCKIKIDRLEIDHIRKKIVPYDYKTSWDVSEGGYVYGFLKKGYYIPAAFYDYGIKVWILDTELEDYKVIPMKHIVCDTTNRIDPVVYELSEEDITRAWEGFSVNGREYIGIAEAINEITWSMETGIWSATMRTHKNNGVLPLGIKYDKK